MESSSNTEIDYTPAVKEGSFMLQFYKKTLQKLSI